jgi:hypothetical protein
MVDTIQSDVGSASQAQNQSTTVVPETTPAVNTTAPAQTPGETVKSQAPAKEEKMLPQSEVNEIVGKAKREASEKAKRDAFLELQKATAASPVAPPMQQYGVPMGQQGANAPQLTQEQIIAIADQRAQINAQQQARNFIDGQIANEFMAKINLAKQKIPDFDKNVYDKLGLGKVPIPLINVFNTVDNPGEVLKEMADNPSKFSDVMNAYVWNPENPELARTVILQISDSIKQNEAAKATPQAPEPLSQVKPSTTGTDNGSPASVKDFRKASYLRG